MNFEGSNIQSHNINLLSVLLNGSDGHTECKYIFWDISTLNNILVYITITWCSEKNAIVFSVWLSLLYVKDTNRVILNSLVVMANYVIASLKMLRAPIKCICPNIHFTCFLEIHTRSVSFPFSPPPNFFFFLGGSSKMLTSESDLFYLVQINLYKVKLHKLLNSSVPYYNRANNSPYTQGCL